VPPGYRSETVSHEGEEILYVLEGAIVVALLAVTVDRLFEDLAHWTQSRVSGTVGEAAASEA